MGEWVNVRDKLPERGVRVLVYCEPEYEEQSSCSSSFLFHTAYLGEFGGGFIEALPNCGCTGLSGNVSHWMELPNPPAPWRTVLRK